MQNNNIKVNVLMGNSYKLGLNEVEGLEAELEALFKPIKDAIQKKIYWNTIEVNQLEYKSRDGFIPYKNNCGGLELCEIIPKCEDYEFDFLEFGEVDVNYIDNYDLMNEAEKEKAWNDEYEVLSSDGHLDALLRVILKFEGFDEAGNMIFYINLCGGNNDAPYYRLKNMPDIYEVEFKAKTFSELRKKGKKPIKKLLKILEGK